MIDLVKMLLTIYQPTDFFRLCRVCLLLLCLQLSFPTHAANAGVELNESEFLADIPMVYSGSRMPQLAADSAGAITVLDRAFIQESGARDIADLFRLVPGFQVGTSAGGRSVVAYHGLSGQISQRMQVYVDGRSLYAPYLFGGVDWSSVRVPLEEIERIEIQRGSNSVTYGANAFLGVIHIITRAAVQSAGFGVQVAQGNEGIRDSSFRWGHGTPTVQWRLSAGSKSDNGVSSRPNQYQINYLDFRSEFQMAAGKELTVLAGLAKSQFGIGYPDRAADPVRAEMVSSSFLHAQYRAITRSRGEQPIEQEGGGDPGEEQAGGEGGEELGPATRLRVRVGHVGEESSCREPAARCAGLPRVAPPPRPGYTSRMPTLAPRPGPDGRPRCSWCLGSDDYLAYHDEEWGRPVVEETRLLEKLCLEGFQSGLSWLTILRKREAFRSAFAGFDPERVARFGAGDVTRLLGDAGIVRHRGKIEATIANARAACELSAAGGSLAALVWRFEPAAADRPRRLTGATLARLTETPESAALSKELKRRGFRFVGPTTAYAFMQAMGLVNDHLDACHVREPVERLRARLRRPR